jgi:hypothetical protein
MGQYLVSSLPAGIVNRLINHYKSLKRNFYTENCYNICPLPRHVLKNKTACLGKSVLDGSLVTTAWHILSSQMEEAASRYGE